MMGAVPRIVLTLLFCLTGYSVPPNHTLVPSVVARYRDGVIVAIENYRYADGIDRELALVEFRSVDGKWLRGREIVLEHRNEDAHLAHGEVHPLHRFLYRKRVLDLQIEGNELRVLTVCAKLGFALRAWSRDDVLLEIFDLDTGRWKKRALFELKSGDFVLDGAFGLVPEGFQGAGLLGAVSLLVSPGGFYSVPDHQRPTELALYGFAERDRRILPDAIMRLALPREIVPAPELASPLEGFMRNVPPGRAATRRVLDTLAGDPHLTLRRAGRLFGYFIDGGDGRKIHTVLSRVPDGRTLMIRAAKGSGPVITTLRDLVPTDRHAFAFLEAPLGVTELVSYSQRATGEKPSVHRWGRGEEPTRASPFSISEFPLPFDELGFRTSARLAWDAHGTLSEVSIREGTSGTRDEAFLIGMIPLNPHTAKRSPCHQMLYDAGTQALDYP